MRAINIKIFNHPSINFILSVILLLSFHSSITAQTYENHSSLLKDAEQQQNKLIASHGHSNQTKWQRKCHQMIESLQLTQFKDCIVIKATFANAYAMAHGSVILTEGLLKNINNDDQLAHILAHEHAHLVLQHHQQAQKLVNNPPKFFTKSRVKKFYRQIEQQADQSADQWLIKFKLDPLQINHYLMRIEKTAKEHSNDHQKIKNRIQRHDLPVEKRAQFWTKR